MAINRFYGGEVGNLGELAISPTGISIDSSTYRSGAYAFKSDGTSTGAANAATNAMLLHGPSQAVSLGDVFYAQCYLKLGDISTPATQFWVWCLQWRTDSSGGASLSTAGLEFNTDGTIVPVLYNAVGTQIAAGSDIASSLNTSDWFRIRLHRQGSTTSTGSAEFYINDTLVVSASATNFSTSAHTTVGFGVQRSGGGAISRSFWWDDFVTSDSGYPDDGVKIIARSPITGAPTYDQWTKTGAVTAWDAWDETPNDGDTTNCNINTFPRSQTALSGSFGSTQTGHGTEALSSETILAARVSVVAKSSSTSSTNPGLTIRYRYNSSDSDSALSNTSYVGGGLLTTSYTGRYGAITASPTLANLNAAEVGAHTAAASSTRTVSAVWAMVAYVPSAGPAASLPPMFHRPLRVWSTRF
jgi:hypothetical protein